MPGYQHPCRYCDQFIEPDTNVCPLCGKNNPLGPLRCQKCRNPIIKGAKKCSHCGLDLTVECPKCGKNTFWGDYCEYCDAELQITCNHCKTKQPLVNETCIKCKKNLK